MTRRSLALVANFHRERRIGRKTANFLRAVNSRLRSRGIDFNVEFVLDRPDARTVEQIETAANGMDGARVHLVDFGNLGASRTFGVEAARAPVVCFTDGDDFFSFNWFEAALDYFGGGPRREILHTRYMVGFDHEQFIRETTDSTDPGFDPLSLAVDWYWSANLAMQTEVFALAPIQPYDHARGFGSEDWHWTCNSLAAGIARVSLPDTSYFYRVKPERHALGKVADVIHMASPLFAAGHLPPSPAQRMVDRPTPSSPGAVFFEQAREIEAHEIGVSYLRGIEAGAREVRHFKPHTPPIVGEVVRAGLASGFRDGSSIVFADAQRLPGGLDFARQLADALVMGPPAPRLYVLDGDGAASHARDDGFVISLGDLRAAGLYNAQIDRLIARFLIQARRLSVVNLLSPRTASNALAYSRATRGGVTRWINLILEYGFDALSQSYDELDAFTSAGIESENIAVFEKTALEAWTARGVALAHDPRFEAAFIAGDFSDYRERRPAPGAVTPSGVALLRPGPRTHSRVHRIDGAAEAGLVPRLPVTDGLRALASNEPECILVAGSAFLGAEISPSGPKRGPGLRIPALSVIRQRGAPSYYLRPSLWAMNRAIAERSAPPDLFSMGVVAVDSGTLQTLLEAHPEGIPLPDLFARSILAALAAGRPALSMLGPRSIASVTAEDLALLGGSRLVRDVTRRLAEERLDG